LVPLVFHYPGIVEPGDSRAPARLVDVAPTVLELLRLPALAGTDGVSLVPLFSGRETRIPPAYLETYQPWHSYGWAPLVGLRSAEWKWIAAPRPELYRLAVDSGESENVAADEPTVVRSLDRLLRESLRAPAVEAARLEDAEALERLAALGYVASAGRASGPTGKEPDPKDRLPLREQLTAAQDLLERGELAPAVERFDQVLALEPTNPFALSRSAAALVRLGRAPEAIARLRQALAASPEEIETRALLAETLGAAGDPVAAAAEWAEVVRRLPRAPRYWSNLGAELGRSGRPADAVVALERALELDPGDPDRLIRLGFAEFAAGWLAPAARDLRQAAERMGDGFLHSGALGLILLEVDERDASLPWLRRAGPAEPEFAEARLALARLELARGNRAAARRALDEALAADPRLRDRVAGEAGLGELLE
jgi:tetratricopeptide (TPR) repeat protein